MYSPIVIFYLIFKYEFLIILSYANHLYSSIYFI